MLDLSGSMYAKTVATTRIQQARAVLQKALAEAVGTSVAVRVYGHRSRTDCSDTELLLGFSREHSPADVKKLLKLRPVGQTPIELALREALEDFRGEKGAILLITDGIESCKGDPCGLAPDLKKAGLRVDTVGFGVGEAEERELRCISEMTGGTYYPAFDEFSFAGAVAQARLEVACRDCGRIHARYETSTSDRPVGIYRLLAGATRNPLTLYPMTNTLSAAPPGAYDLWLVPEEGGELMLRGVRVEPEQVANVSFPGSQTGEIEASYSTKEGREIRAQYQALARPSGKAYEVFLLTHKPQSIPSGTWDLVLKHEGEELRLPGVVVEPGKRTRVAFKRGAPGNLLAHYEPLAGLAAIRYRALDLETGSAFPGKLLTNREAELPPGNYELVLVPQEGLELRLPKVVVRSGKSARAEFSSAGVGVLHAVYDPEVLPAFPFAASSGGKAYPGPLLTNQSMLLPVGTYELLFRPPEGRPLRIENVQVEEGRTARVEFRQ